MYSSDSVFLFQCASPDSVIIEQAREAARIVGRNSIYDCSTKDGRSFRRALVSRRCYCCLPCPVRGGLRDYCVK
jgi:hypothetical protein